LSERGVFALDRGIFDHPIFAPEPYTEREAWVWMLSAAAWADKRVRVGKAMIDLKRGQLAFATRFLAVKWKWAHSKVVRFLNRLKTDTMIVTLPKREATLITICNYDQYQFGGNATETPTGTPTGTEVKRNRNKEEETNNLRTKKDGGPVAKATRTREVYSGDFETAFWKPFPRTPIMSKKEAWREWMKLDPDQRVAACRAIEPYRRHLKQNPTLNAVHACRFLSQNRAEGILELAAETPKFDPRASMI
jgi:hypothetical protein